MPAIIAGESSVTLLIRTPFGIPVLSERLFCDILPADADISAAHIVGEIFNQLFDLRNCNARHHVVSLGTVGSAR